MKQSEMMMMMNVWGLALGYRGDRLSNVVTGWVTVLTFGGPTLPSSIRPRLPALDPGNIPWIFWSSYYLFSFNSGDFAISWIGLRTHKSVLKFYQGFKSPSNLRGQSKIVYSWETDRHGPQPIIGFQLIWPKSRPHMIGFVFCFCQHLVKISIHTRPEPTEVRPDH